MEGIVTQVITKMVEEILKNFREGGLSDICTNSTDIMHIVKANVLDLFSGVIEYLDEEFKGSSLRKNLGLTVQARKVSRSVLLPMGELQFSRTMYFSKENNCYEYPIDSIIGLEARERISSETSAMLIEACAYNSYEMSSEKVTKGAVSKQTVKNKLLEVGELATESSHQRKKIDHLDLYVDEAHVSVQEGSSKIVPLVVASEGKEANGTRTRLVNPTAFQGYMMKNKDFWEGVSAYLREEYDIGNCKITIHADGGTWIKRSKDVFLNASFVMDEFHIEQHLKQICANEIGRKYSLQIRNSVESCNKEGLKRLQQRMLSEVVYYTATEEALRREKERINEEFKYFFNNWEAICNRQSFSVTGSCTEAMVSHILAKRLSRNPMWWSEAGLSKQSMLLVYLFNGNHVKASDVGKGRVERTEPDHKGVRRRPKPAPAKNVAKYMEYAKVQMSECLDKKLDWSIFSKENYKNGKVTGLSTIMKAYGTCKFSM